MEIEAIKSIFDSHKPIIFTGVNASESNLKSVDSPDILHIATHGFFLEDQDSLSASGVDTSNKIEPLFSIPKDFEQISAHVTSNFENPLLRSGLAFYGANQASDQTLKSDQDGLLVALEVSTLKLTNTDLVVLSACDTGLGNIPRSQGVTGLRRAFQEAGARSILMSLWQVPDKETKDLMLQFYKKLYDGKSKIESIHEASLDIMRSVKEKKGTTHPFYWGGFVLLGDPGIVN